jgi:polar amino acid transport system substrate-binding protein
MARPRIVTLGLVSLLAVACGPAGASLAPTVGPTTQTPAAPTQAAVVTPEPTQDACAKENLTTLTPGTLTIGADNPAYPPYYIPEDPAPAGSVWELGQPPNGKGLESATAYAVAEELGFADSEVTWVVAPFNTAIQPGPKTFDYYLTQVSYSPERAEAVDLSDGYFDLNQAVVALQSNAIAQVTTVAALKDFRLGSQVGTTSYAYITDQIQPTAEARAYESMDDALEGLNADQIDGVVADLPTTFYMRDAQLTGGVIVGSLPTAPGAEVEHFSILLDKGSALTDCVNRAIAAIKADGTLDAIVNDWIAGQGAPELQ